MKEKKSDQNIIFREAVQRGYEKAFKPSRDYKSCINHKTTMPTKPTDKFVYYPPKINNK